jgi:hypothetical protein
MSSENGLWFSLLSTLLIGVLLLLRVRWPQLSRRWETAALTIGATMFFSLCHFLLPR